MFLMLSFLWFPMIYTIIEEKNNLQLVMFLELFSVFALWMAHRINPIEDNFAQECGKKFFKITDDGTYINEEEDACYNCCTAICRFDCTGKDKKIIKKICDYVHIVKDWSKYDKLVDIH